MRQAGKKPSLGQKPGQTRSVVLVQPRCRAPIGQPACGSWPISAALSPPCYWVEENKNKQSESGAADARREAAAAEAATAEELGAESEPANPAPGRGADRGGCDPRGK